MPVNLIVLPLSQLEFYYSFNEHRRDPEGSCCVCFRGRLIHKLITNEYLFSFISSAVFVSIGNYDGFLGS